MSCGFRQKSELAIVAREFWRIPLRVSYFFLPNAQNSEGV